MKFPDLYLTSTLAVSLPSHFILFHASVTNVLGLCAAPLFNWLALLSQSYKQDGSLNAIVSS